MTAATSATVLLPWAKEAPSSSEIDFRYERAEKTGLEIKPGDKLLLAVKAADKFDLAGEPHVATGDRYHARCRHAGGSAGPA